MTPLRTMARDRTRLAAWLFALVLFARILVPAGWMPSADQGRWVEICTGNTTSTVWLDSGGTAHSGKTSEGEHMGGACVFGAASFAFDAPALAGLALTHVLVAGDLVLPALTLAIGRGLAAPPPPKTGPPVLN